MQKCFKTDKMIFSKDEARERVKCSQKHKEKVPTAKSLKAFYFCDDCMGYHITSKVQTKQLLKAMEDQKQEEANISIAERLEYLKRKNPYIR
jgi:hypothetical protein